MTTSLYTEVRMGNAQLQQDMQLVKDAVIKGFGEVSNAITQFQQATVAKMEQMITTSTSKLAKLELDVAKNLKRMQENSDKMQKSFQEGVVKSQTAMVDKLKEVAVAVEKVGRATQETKKHTEGLFNAFGSLGSMAKSSLVFLGTSYMMQAMGGLVSLPETIANAVSRLEEFRHKVIALTGDTRAAFMAMSSSIRLGVGPEEFGKMFSRFALARENVGATAEGLVEFSNAVIMIGRQGGASLTEMTNGAIQLSQALAKGKLQGQDLRLILEDVPALGMAITEMFREQTGMAMTMGDLAKMTEAGTFTATKLYEALIQYARKHREELEKVPYTNEMINQGLETQLSLLEAQGRGFTAWYSRLKVGITEWIQGIRLADDEFKNLQNTQDMVAKTFGPPIGKWEQLGRTLADIASFRFIWGGGAPQASNVLGFTVEDLEEANDQLKAAKERLQRIGGTPEAVSQISSVQAEVESLYKAILKVSRERLVDVDDIRRWGDELERIRLNLTIMRSGELGKIRLGGLPDLTETEQEFKKALEAYKKLEDEVINTPEAKAKKAADVAKFLDDLQQRAKQGTAALGAEIIKAYEKESQVLLSKHEKNLADIDKRRTELMDKFVKEGLPMFDATQEYKDMADYQQKLAQFLQENVGNINKAADAARDAENKRHQEALDNILSEMEAKERMFQLEQQQQQRRIEMQEQMQESAETYRRSEMVGTPSGVDPRVAKALDEAAYERGVDRALLYAIAKYESGFNPNARNPLMQGGRYTGGHGLMQLIPSNFPPSWKAYPERELWRNPEENAMAGAALVKEYAQLFGATAYEAIVKKYVGYGVAHGGDTAHVQRILADRERFAAQGGAPREAERERLNLYKEQQRAIIERNAQDQKANVFTEQYIKLISDYMKSPEYAEGQVIPKEALDRIRQSAQLHAETVTTLEKENQLRKLGKDIADKQYTQDRKAKEEQERFDKRQDELRNKLAESEKKLADAYGASLAIAKNKRIEEVAVADMEQNISDTLTRAEIARYQGNEQLAVSYERYAEQQQIVLANLQAEIDALNEIERINKERLAAGLPEIAKESAAYKQMFEEIKAAHLDMSNVVTIQNRKMQRDVENDQDIAKTRYKDWVKDIAKGSEDIMSDWLYNAMQGKFDNIFIAFKQMIDKMVAAALAAKLMEVLFGQGFMNTSGPTGSAPGGLIGSLVGLGMSAFGLGGAGGGSFYSVMAQHSGGIVGANEGTFWGKVPKMHSGGLLPDEYPIVARKGEGIFTPGQMKALGLLFNRAGTDTEASVRSTVRNAVINLNINQPIDVTGFRRSKKQLMREAMRELATARA